MTAKERIASCLCADWIMRWNEKRLWLGKRSPRWLRWANGIQMRRLQRELGLDLRVEGSRLMQGDRIVGYGWLGRK